MLAGPDPLSPCFFLWHRRPSSRASTGGFVNEGAPAGDVGSWLWCPAGERQQHGLFCLLLFLSGNGGDGFDACGFGAADIPNILGDGVVSSLFLLCYVRTINGTSGVRCSFRAADDISSSRLYQPIEEDWGTGSAWGGGLSWGTGSAWGGGLSWGTGRQGAAAVGAAEALQGAVPMLGEAALSGHGGDDGGTQAKGPNGAGGAHARLGDGAGDTRAWRVDASKGGRGSSAWPGDAAGGARARPADAAASNQGAVSRRL
ncbi:uncharacterized PE-PGRS family protein PE_PGRS54-like [Panicum virgatum]|uniref:uncharacterized PE-PGRS family protein PE_PGRS54-like n=1 Tax=Panicum virgatum TaxID=38727 RepID=UPI0019D574D3|nr:uncharacterized PE-PGRS family protein PE_PGRS54-like [Panicum virgatum]